MSLDREIAKRGWRRYAAYPGATIAGMFTNTVFGFIQAYILLAVFRHRTDIGGYDAGDTVTYVWLAQALIMTVYMFGWQELALRIRDGSIATDLARPLDPQRYWLAFDLGRAPYHFIFRGVPPFVFGALVFHSTTRRRPTRSRSRQRRARGRRQPRLPVPLQLGGVLARRHPRRDEGLAHVVAVLLGDGAAARVLPGMAANDRARAAVRSRSCRRRSTSGSASTTARRCWA